MTFFTITFKLNVRCYKSYDLLLQSSRVNKCLTKLIVTFFQFVTGEIEFTTVDLLTLCDTDMVSVL